jgi:hypothetical protein
MVERFSSSVTFHIKKICNVEQILIEKTAVMSLPSMMRPGGWVICRQKQSRDNHERDILSSERTVTVLKHPERQDLLNVPILLYPDCA